jgi:soluble lytic murein transglycosylase
LIVGILNSNAFWKWLYPIPYFDDIREIAFENRVDPFLIAAVIRTESKFNETNVSHAGAIGLMQLMPQTAQWIADKSGVPYKEPTELAEPVTNIRLGSWYIAYLQQRYNGNLAAAVAAYNAGPNRVDTWLKTGVWSGKLEESERIPVGETRHFVGRVFYNYQKYSEIYRKS